MEGKLAEYLGSLDRLHEIPASEIPAVLAHLAAIQTALAARLLTQTAEKEDLSIPTNGLTTVEKAALRLDFTAQYVYEMIRRGEIPAVRTGKYVRLRESDLEKWIERHTEKALDKCLYRAYSIDHGRKRTSKDSAVSRLNAGSNGGADRRGTKHRGTVGTGRVENIRARLAVDPLARRDKADSNPQE